MKKYLSQARQLIKECKKTQSPYLELGNCGIINLNDLPELFECTHLETLILSDSWFVRSKLTDSQNNGQKNSIKSIPSKISYLVKLEKLIVEGDRGYSEITDISFLEKLTGLYTLNLGINKISDIRILEKLTGLQSLSLSSNKISDIRILEKLTGLQSLYLGNNNISDIRFIEKLTGLQSLYLGFNGISDIRFLSKLTGLQSLDLNNNKISDVRFIEKLTQLQSLDLSNNKISDIRFLEKLTGLQSLELQGNKISDIRFLENHTGLQSLDLRSNPIREIPLSIFQLDMKINLEGSGDRGLSLYNNPIESPPMEILKQGRQSVLDWFEATKKKLDEIKIILIGDPKAGKTSLLRRLKEDVFDEKEAQTDGINIEDIRFGDCKTFEKQTALHKLTGHFWDFGGQEIMNATHQFFLTNRSVYVLVLDARKDAKVSAQITEWVKRIQATGGNSAIIIVANQIDVNPGFGFDNEYELQKEFPQIKYFIKASCNTKENIEIIKEKLEELIPQAELFNTPIDERWISIKEKLQEETKSYRFLNETRFLEICNEFQLSESREQKNAINFLHDLGLVLHFENVNLSEYYVLDPYWITYGVYRILTSAYAGNNNGVVSMNKLEFIVNEEKDKNESYRPPKYKKIQYSPNQRLFLVAILNQFKLCFYLPDHDQFIIPDLLATSEPNKITEPIRITENSIRFVYEYEYLPNSIMPHVMVDTHRILLEKWRTGFVLQNDGCKALVTNYQNRISIIVSGEHRKKREFLAVIRYLLDSINRDLSDKPDLLIPLPGVDAYADYEVLLIREKKGKQYFILDEDKPTEKQFEISKLLEGIPSQDEVRKSGDKFEELLLIKLDDLKSDLEIIKETQNEIKIKLNEHYTYLIQIPEINKIKDDILVAIKEMDAQQSEEITEEIMQGIAKAFKLQKGDTDKKLNDIFTDLKKTDDVQMKLKLSVPFINLLGINLETEFDVKNWATKMYEKHEMKIFKLRGLL